MSRITGPRRLGAGLVLGLVLGLGSAVTPAAATAQLGDPVPQALGLGGNYLAVARGFAAVSSNPAALGMPDNPRMSFSLLPVGMTAGMDPVSPLDLAEFEGQLIPRETREEWVDLIRRQGGESGNFNVDLTYVGLSIGPFAIQASSNVRARANVAPDVAEILFFGNAGRTGQPGDYSLEGSAFDAAGTSTLAASFAVPLSIGTGPLPGQHFAIGATVKYTVGNFLVLGREDSSTLTSSPLGVSIRFPMVHSVLPGDSAGFDALEGFDNGRGFGLDLGAAWQAGIFSGGVTVRNIINTFEWDLSGLQYRAGEATWTADSSATSFETLPAEAAPAELLERIHDLYELSPVVAAGGAARVLPYLTLTGEVRHAVKDNLHVGARNHAGVGAELRIIPFLPLRAGVSVISGGYQLSGGLGLKLGGMQLGASGALRDGELGSDVLAAVGLTFGLR